MQNKNLNPIIDLRSQYYIENLEKNWYKVKKRKWFDLLFLKKLVVIAWFILFFLTIYLNYFYLKTEAKKVVVAKKETTTKVKNTEQEKIRLSRIESCQKYAKIEKIYWQDAVVRCATSATIVFAFESDFWKSNICLNRKNCFWMKWNWVEYPTGFINFKNFEKWNEYFAKKYFQFHYKKKVPEFVRSWSMTDRDAYISFFNVNYKKIYNENLKLKKFL